MCGARVFEHILAIATRKRVSYSEGDVRFISQYKRSRRLLKVNNIIMVINTTESEDSVNSKSLV